MKIELTTAKAWTGRVRAAFMFEGDRWPLGFPGQAGRVMTAIAAGEGFTGKLRKTILLRDRGGVEKVIVAGLGRRREFEPDSARAAAAKIMKQAEDIGASELGLVVPDNKAVAGDLAEFIGAAVEGALLGSYSYLKYKSPKPDDQKAVQRMTLVFESAKNKSAAMEKVVRDAEKRCRAVCFVRDVANEPSQAKPPMTIAELAKGLARPGRITVSVLDAAELKKRGMGGILAVGQGSHSPPCLVHLTYKPKQKPKKALCFVGKGITFDSGGISIKPSQGMEAMKDDMAGAGAVLGLFRYLGEADVPVAVHGLVPLAENMPGGGAQRPGDVVRHYGGKTSEVISTDAEGRLILADALAYGAELKPDLMVDVATLTGACVVALGDEYSALLGTSAKVVQRLITLGRKQGEFFWELPLVSRYRPHMKSTIADVKNVGKPQNAGTIIGGLFLKEFVPEDVPWVHIDVAGASFTKEGWDYCPPGATGVPLRTLIALVRS